MKKFILLMLFFCFLTLNLTGCFGSYNNGISGTPDVNINMTPRQISINDRIDFEEIVEIVSPAIVGISANYGNIESVGSGVAVANNGYVLTNNHVVEGASSITVYYANKTSGRATLIWNDPAMDLAVIKTSINMPYLKAGNNELVSSGQEVIAIGTPLTLQFKHTVTKGIISATNRTIEVENEDGTTSYLQNLFQHDASINPGNSGGPLINEKGEVIGINTLKVSQAEGIGFAIPVQIAMPVVNHISQDGSYTTPYLGIFGFDSEIAVFYGRTLNKNGVYVVNVDSNGPLGRAGIKEGDIIIGVEDLPITTMLDLRKTIYNYKVGEKINIKILREGFEKIFEIKLENRK